VRKERAQTGHPGGTRIALSLVKKMGRRTMREERMAGKERIGLYEHPRKGLPYRRGGEKNENQVGENEPNAKEPK